MRIVSKMSNVCNSRPPLIRDAAGESSNSELADNVKSWR